MAEDTRICLGAIAGAHGVRGDVRLKSFCAEPADIAAYGPLETEGRDRRFAVRLLKPVKEGFAARLEGVATREAAEALRGTRLYVERTRLPRLPDD
ncbi:MAG: ribosome maturation factor RimM, partial [Pseudomonadota bacterium]